MREVLSAHPISRSSSGFSQKYDLSEPRQPIPFLWCTRGMAGVVMMCMCCSGVYIYILVVPKDAFFPCVLWAFDCLLVLNMLGIHNIIYSLWLLLRYTDILHIFVYIICTGIYIYIYLYIYTSTVHITCILMYFAYFVTVLYTLICHDDDEMTMVSGSSSPVNQQAPRLIDAAPMKLQIETRPFGSKNIG